VVTDQNTEVILAREGYSIRDSRPGTGKNVMEIRKVCPIQDRSVSSAEVVKAYLQEMFNTWIVWMRGRSAYWNADSIDPLTCNVREVVFFDKRVPVLL
jgi:hypothetical protein